MEKPNSRNNLVSINRKNCANSEISNVPKYIYLPFFLTCGVTFGVAFGFDFEEVAPALILTPDLFGELDGVGAVEVVLVLTTLVVLVCD
jgi:hypothetical protein